MSFWADERGAAIQVGAIIIFAFLVIAIASYQASVVPSQNKNVEFNYNQQVQSQVQDVHGAIESTAAVGNDQTVTVDLATSYPARTIFINPPPPTGTLRSVGTTHDGVSIEVANAIATDDDIDDYWDGTTTQNYSTGALTYDPNYHVYTEAPVTVVENSLVYNIFDDSTSLSVTSQSMFDGDRISLTALRGTLREQGGTASVTVQPISTSTQTITVEDDGTNNVTVSVVSRLSEEQWRQILLDEEEFYNQSQGGHVVSVTQTDTVALDASTTANVITFEMELGETYTLQMARVGVGQLDTGDRTTNASYSIALVDQATTGEDVNQTLTYEVRDQYNNPLSGVSVNATVAGSVGGNVVDGTLTTDEDGRVTFTYNTTENIDGSAKTEDVRVSHDSDPATSYDASDPADVETQVTVKNTDGSGTGGGGGGGGGAYTITFDDAPSDNWNVDAEGSTITLTASTDPALDGVSTDFAVNNSSVATISNEDAETDSNGDTDVELTAQANGSVAVYVASAGSSDVINVTVTGVVSGGGGGNTAPTASFTSSTTSPSTGESVSFDASGSSDTDGSIVSYEWDFGDGTTATGETTSHTYTADGSYTVTLTVTDDDGATDTASQTITVSNQAPTADFTASSLNIKTGETIDFDGSNSNDPDGSIVSYQWTFGDGNTSSGSTASNQYGEDGTYDVTLTVTDDDGATDSVTKTVTVSNRQPTADFSWSCTGATCSFDASASSDPDGTISSYSWDFDDGTTGTGQTTSHSYSPPGTYNVTLTVTDNDGDTRIVSKNVTTGGGITFVSTSTWASYDSVIEQEIRNDRNDEVEIISVKVNETPGKAKQLDGSDVGIGYPEVEFYDGGRIGSADSAGGYTLPANMSLETDGTVAVVSSGDTVFLYLNEFQKQNGQAVDMRGESVTITITYRVNGKVITETVTVNVPF